MGSIDRLGGDGAGRPRPARDLARTRWHATGREPGTRIRPPLILGHFLLAAAGLVLWIVYVATDSDALAWVAFVLLFVVAGLGFAMFAIWFQRRQRGAVREAIDPGTPAEQHFPVAVVGLHGLLAATTLVLVFLAAAGVG
jgi:hypothetical protein